MDIRSFFSKNAAVKKKKKKRKIDSSVTSESSSPSKTKKKKNSETNVDPKAFFNSSTILKDNKTNAKTSSSSSSSPAKKMKKKTNDNVVDLTATSTTKIKKGSSSSNDVVNLTTTTTTTPATTLSVQPQKKKPKHEFKPPCKATTTTTTTTSTNEEVPKKKPKWNPRSQGTTLPPNYGKVEIPKDCDSRALCELTFVITGILNSLTREQAKTLILDHGGRVTTGVSGKTSYLVSGALLEDGRKASEGSKSVKANALKIPIIDEAKLIHLLRTRKPPAPKKTPTPKKKSSTPKKKKTSMSKTTTTTTTTTKKTEKKNVDPTTMLWSVKHRPRIPKELIGNSSNVVKLTNWLKNWNRKFRGKGAKKKRTPAQLKAFNAQRGVMLSGPPGIGKTSAATLLANSMGYEVVEFNASDKRSKKSMFTLADAVRLSLSLFIYRIQLTHLNTGK